MIARALRLIAAVAFAFSVVNVANAGGATADEPCPPDCKAPVAESSVQQ